MALDPIDPEFARVVNEGMIPMIRESAIVTAIIPPENPDHLDINFCIQVGAFVLMDKPLLVLALPGSEISDKLRLIADEIVYIPEAGIGSDEGQTLIQEAIARMGMNIEENPA